MAVTYGQPSYDCCVAGHGMENPKTCALGCFLALACILACSPIAVERHKTFVDTSADGEQFRAGTVDTDVPINHQFGACKTNRLTIECGIKVDCVPIIGVSQCLT